MIIYICKSLLCLSTCWMLYKVFLENKKSFEFNRLFLLTGLLGGVIAPLIAIPFYQHVVGPIELIVPPFNNIPVQIVDFGTKTPTSIETSAINLYSILIWLYAMGCLFFGMRYMMNLIVLVRKTFATADSFAGRLRIISVEDQTSPFSFFNTLFINGDDYKKGISQAIISHELYHADKLHSLDLLLIEIVKVAHWWNPLVFFMAKSIKDNHEYAADQYARSTINNYSEQLIKSALPEAQANLFQSAFAHSSLLKRLKMINSKKRTSGYREKILVIILMIFSIVACTENSFISSEDNSEDLELTIVPGLYGTNEYVYPTIVVNKVKEKNMDIINLGLPEYRIPPEDLLVKMKNENNYKIVLDGKPIENSRLASFDREYIKGYSISGQPRQNSRPFRAELYSHRGYLRMVDTRLEQSSKFLLNNSTVSTIKHDKKESPHVDKIPWEEKFNALAYSDNYNIYIDGELVEPKSLLKNSHEEFTFYSERAGEIHLWTEKGFKKYITTYREKMDKG